MKSEVRLKIADIIIQIKSRFGLAQPTREEREFFHSERFDNFFYKGRGDPDIHIKVNIVDTFPGVIRARPLFITSHFENNEENWRLLKKGGSYIYKSPLKDKRQVMFINKTFDKVSAYLLNGKDRGGLWGISEIIYDFLQVLLINYLALHRKGIFIHSTGLKDTDAEGLLFAGESGAGKSTTSRLWHKYSRAMVLNDDRMIVRKYGNKFLIYGSCWHGDFNDYLDSRIESAPLRRLFFIRHARRNTVRRVSAKEAFNLLYPNLFPTFWDREGLENIVSFAQDIVTTVPCYRLGFVNNRKIIPFVRNI